MCRNGFRADHARETRCGTGDVDDPDPQAEEVPDLLAALQGAISRARAARRTPTQEAS